MARSNNIRSGVIEIFTRKSKFHYVKISIFSTVILPILALNRLFCFVYKNKPIFSVGSDCGDYVVVINSKDITLKNDLWRTHNFFHHTR